MLNILIVDDEQIVLDSVCKHLRNEHYRLFTALSAVNAKEIISKENINIVLTDLMMPEIDGLEFLRYSKVINPAIIVILITGFATINTALQAMQLGAFDYIAKPFTRDELRRVVTRAAELASSIYENPDGIPGTEKESERIFSFKGLGANTWMVHDDDGSVLLGLERPFLYGIGSLQSVYLPSKGDEIRQGAVYFQVFSADLRSHTLLSPLSGYVIDVNRLVIENPNEVLQDPYGEGWLIRILPTNFNEEIKLLGL